MVSYSEIFEEIVEIVRYDYAGCEEKQDWVNPDYYRNLISQLEKSQTMTPNQFKDIVSDYLIHLQDQHIYFIFDGKKEIKAQTRGFKVRRFKDALYVTEAIEEKRFKLGMKITSIDNQTIIQKLTSEPNSLRGNSSEREDWSHIINNALFVTIEDEHKKYITFELKNYEPIHLVKDHDLKVINVDTLLIVLPSFANVERTLGFIEDQKEQIKNCKNLIIDVRNNSGGNNQATSTLLPYIFPRNQSLNIKNEPREFNYTKRNSDLFIQLCQNFRKVIKDKEALNDLDSAEELCRKHSGDGFVALDFSDSLKEKASTFVGTDSPQKVVILTDVYCASAAEYFVDSCRPSAKVTVVGRSTMGVNDYSDLVIKQWPEMFSLYYPISRRVKKTPNHPIHGKGIQPDHYIPWTPEHIFEDFDLNYAVYLLEGKKN